MSFLVVRKMSKCLDKMEAIPHNIIILVRGVMVLLLVVTSVFPFIPGPSRDAQPVLI
jgi:hypothetical protein